MANTTAGVDRMYFRVKEYAELTGQSLNHIYRLVKARQIPFKQDGRVILIPKDHLTKLDCTGE